MKPLGPILWKGFCAFCLATLLVEGGMLVVAWQRGWLQTSRLQRAMEAFYGVQRREIHTRLTSIAGKDGAARAQEQMAKRIGRGSDIPLRAGAARRDAIEIGVERNSVRNEQSRYEQTRIGFDKALDANLKKLENAAIDSTQALLEQLTPTAAKEHLMLMLTAPGDGDAKKALDDIVDVMRRMSADRRRKIFAQFETPDEAAQVEAMLRRIREIETPETEPRAAAEGGAPP